MVTLNRSSIPQCEICSSPREFEFQLMPACLQHLKNQGEMITVDFGTVIVFTCPANCLKKKVVKEYVLLQHDPDRDLFVK